MNQKKFISVKFSEGLGIFDDHYGYPVIDEGEKYNGPTGKVIDIQGPQAHAGRNFFIPEGKEFSIDIDESPYLHIAIKAEEGTNTCLFLMVHDKRPDDHKKRFVVIGKTPQGDPGICDIIIDHFTIVDDGNWHEYEFDLRKIQEKYEDYPYFPNAGSISIIQFYSRTGSGEHTFHFNDLLLTQESQLIITTFKGLLYVKHGRVGTRSEGPDYYLQTRIGDFRLCYEKRNLWEPDYLLEYYSRRMVEVKGEIEEKMIINVKHINEICESLIPETHKIFKAKIVNSSSSEITDIRLGMIGADKNISIDSLAVGSSTGSGEHTFHFNDLLLTQESQPITTTFKGLLYVKHGRVGTRSEGPDYYLQTRIGDFRLCYEKRNLWEPDYLLEYYSRRMVEVKGEIEEKMIINVKHINEICESLIPETHKIFKAKIVNSSSSEITDIRLGMTGADKNISIDSLAVGSSTEQYEFLLRDVKIRPITHGDYRGGYTQLGVEKLIFIPHPPGMITILAVPKLKFS